MLTDLEQLVKDFYDFFFDLYKNNNDGGSEEAFLAFEPIGTGLSPSMFALNTGQFSPLLAVEQFSSSANQLPILEGKTIKSPSLKTADGLYDLMVVAAQPHPSADRVPVDKFRSAADEAFDRAITPPLLRTGRSYCPAVATPPDWCSPDGAASWTSKKFVSAVKTETTTGPDPAPDPTSKGKWSFRVLPTEFVTAVVSHSAMMQAIPKIQDQGSESIRLTDDVLHQVELPSGRVTVSDSTTAELTPMHAINRTRSINLSAARVNPSMFAAHVEIAPASALRAAHLNLAEATAIRPIRSQAATELLLVRSPSQLRATSLNNPAAFQISEMTSASMALRVNAVAAQSQTLNSVASSQEIKSKTLSLGFDYCLVTITRPWISTEFLTLKTWFLPGFKAGDLSSGSGAANAPFEVMPMAALVVKNLLIKAEQSDLVHLQDSVGFGPFSFVGRTVEDGQLKCEGMQIIGWVCVPMPLLPPMSDPTLA